MIIFKKLKKTAILLTYGRKKLIYALLITVMAVTTAFVSAPMAKTVFNAAAASTKRKIPIYSVQTTQKKVALTFDAAWGADDTDTLLQILADNDVKATFFLCGYWIDKYPDEVKKIYEAGNDIGNHSDRHLHGAQLSLEQNQTEIDNVTKKLNALFGFDMPVKLFRAPYGEYNNTVMEAADSLGYYTIQWDVDSLDWKEYGVESEINQVLNNKHLGDGSIILLHNDAKYTPQALDAIIKGLKSKGYEIVPVSQLIYKSAYTIDHTGRQIPNS